MKITNMRRISGGGTLVALFDLEVTPEVTLIDWQLRLTPKGLRAFPTASRGARWSAQVAPHALSRIGQQAGAMYEEGSAPHDEYAKAG